MENEKVLIKRIQKHGDKKAADELITVYYKEIYAFVYRQVGQMQLSMDLTQDIFISMLRSIDLYVPKKGAFKTWLYRIASNKVVDYFRSGSYKNLSLITDIEECEFFLSNGENMEIQAENKVLVQKVMYHLSLYDFEIQQIMRLKFFSEKTFCEIAEILSMSENTVKTKYYKALKNLRKDVEADEY